MADLSCSAGQRGKRRTASTLADLNRGPATDGTETETERGIANGTRTRTVTGAVPPTETASETETAIKTETGTTTARGIETVTTGPSAGTAARGTTTATATIDGTVTATAREIANGTGTTGGRSGLVRILTKVGRMRKDAKTTQQRTGLPADAGLNLDLRGGIAQKTLIGAGGTMIVPGTTDAEMTDSLGALPPLPLPLPLGETRPLATLSRFPFLTLY